MLFRSSPNLLTRDPAILSAAPVPNIFRNGAAMLEIFSVPTLRAAEPRPYLICRSSSAPSLRRGLRSLPCASSPHKTRFAGLSRGPLHLSARDAHIYRQLPHSPLFPHGLPPVYFSGYAGTPRSSRAAETNCPCRSASYSLRASTPLSTVLSAPRPVSTRFFGRKHLLIKPLQFLPGFPPVNPVQLFSLRTRLVNPHQNTGLLL